MKKYRFPLARLERVREAQLSLARAELAAANAAVDEATAARSASLEALSASSAPRAADGGTEPLASWVARRQAAAVGLTRAAEVLDGARDVRDVALDHYRGRREDHEVLVRIDGRRRELWRAEVLAAEVRELDEFVSQQRARRQGDGEGR